MKEEVTNMKIDKAKYQGYLWYSNEKQPKVYNNEELELEMTGTENPFIVEGQLYDAEARKSLSIKFVDGKYLVKETILADLDSLECTVEKFVPNRMEGVKRLIFKRVWRADKDEMCENMEVLKPAELVFVGFETEKGGDE